jgi:DNA modification methylase
MNIDLRLGDCLEVLKTIPDNSIDSVVTDPPYGLSFMGKKWDYDVPSVEVWTECFRVLKPGGHLLSFAGSRTYHRMAVRIEDAGFEIRDQIMWVYGQGFPKSQNISKSLLKLADEKERTEQNTKHNLRCMPDSNLQETELINEEQDKMLFSHLPKQDLERILQNEKFGKESKESVMGREESILEGRGDIQETEGELQGSKIHKMSEGIYGDGEERWIHNGTQISNGETSQQIIDEDGSSASHRPQPIKQSNTKSNVVSEQLTSQEIREIAQRYNNFGSSLKPAHEPIVMARKPLSEKSIAENVLKHGTGGINIDGSRIEMKQGDKMDIRRYNEYHDTFSSYEEGESPKGKEYIVNEPHEGGRFPANIIFDEEAGQLLDEQSGISKGNKPSKRNKNHRYSQDWGHRVHDGMPIIGYEDKGGASRFFYCPKAAKKDRGEGIELINHHPTVKPTDLMRYLINLVTPPNGTILDPFMGSGSTGKAAVRCGLNFIGIEKEQEYMDIASARIEHEKNKPIQTKLFDVNK